MDAAGLALAVLSTLAVVVEKGREIYKDYKEHARFLDTTRWQLMTQEILLREALSRLGLPPGVQTATLESHLTGRLRDGFYNSENEVRGILEAVGNIYAELQKLLQLLEVPPNTTKFDSLTEKTKKVFQMLKQSRKREEYQKQFEYVRARVFYLYEFSRIDSVPHIDSNTSAQAIQNQHDPYHCRKLRSHLGSAHRALSTSLCHGCDPPHKAIIYLDRLHHQRNTQTPVYNVAISYGDEQERPWRKILLTHQPVAPPKVSVAEMSDPQTALPRGLDAVTTPPENTLCEEMAIGSSSGVLIDNTTSASGTFAYEPWPGQDYDIVQVAPLDTTYRTSGRRSRTLQEKYRMAVYLAWTVLHFGDDIWMKSPKDTSWAKVFKEQQNEDMAGFAIYPCLELDFSNTLQSQTAAPSIPPASNPDNQLAFCVTNNAIFTVGILLAELFLADGPGNDESPALSKSLRERASFALKNYHDIVNDAGLSYACVVGRCIKMEFLEANLDLSNRDTRKEFHFTVFAPLLATYRVSSSTKQIA